MDDLLFSDLAFYKKYKDGKLSDEELMEYQKQKEAQRLEYENLYPTIVPDNCTNNTQNLYPTLNPSTSEPKNQPLNIMESTSLKEIAVEHIPTNILKGKEDAYKPIPFVGEAAVAGFANTDFAIKERDIKDYYVIPKFKESNIDFMIEIHGESMYPTFKSGDVVACTFIRESTFIQWNRVHLIATTEQGILIKRLKKGMTDTTITLVSDNPDYDPFEVELTSIKGIALVQGLVRLE